MSVIAIMGKEKTFMMMLKTTAFEVYHLMLKIIFFLERDHEQHSIFEIKV